MLDFECDVLGGFNLTILIQLLGGFNLTILRSILIFYPCWVRVFFVCCGTDVQDCDLVKSLSSRYIVHSGFIKVYLLRL